jgi:hypothetical protein
LHLTGQGRAAHLYLKRVTQAEIGAKLGLSRQQVGYDLEAIRREWLESLVSSMSARETCPC